MRDTPLRILHISAIYAPAYVYGGPARSVPLLCEALARVGAAVTVLTTNANGRPRPSTAAWIFVVRPPRERPTP